MYIDLSLDKPMEQFSIEYQKESQLRFYITLLCNWSKKHVPSSQPIRCKTNHKCHLEIPIFPFLQVFSLFSFWVLTG